MRESDLTRLLDAAHGGGRAALDELYRAVYGELHQLARQQMRREGRAVTLQPTMLVNKATNDSPNGSRSGWPPAMMTTNCLPLTA